MHSLRSWQDHKAPWVIRAFIVGLAVLLLYFSFRGTNWEELGQALRQVQPGLLVMICLVASLSYLVRGLRWRVLLSVQKPLPRPPVFWANMAGYLGNNFLPARAGEFLRAGLVGRLEGMDASFALATALTERMLDAITLVFISLLALLFIQGLPGWLVSTIRLIGIAGAAGMAGIFLAPRLDRFIMKLVERLPLPEPLRRRSFAFIHRFLNGLQAFRHPQRALEFAGYTAVIWLLDAISNMVAARAFGQSLSLPQALLFLAALGLASALPSTPGYLGVYQFVAVSVLPLFGFTRQVALAYMIVIQGLGYVVVTTLGLAGLWSFGVGWSGLLKAPNETKVWRQTPANSQEIPGAE